ncbi:MMPL family transporter [Stackebrandtia nassauensis]|uniref:MMPL domain protein n=1 Tax=Stackebrandtia nassauensis (strain DSM 44728 / CIP 108903 / NRRL B-16338 / NBRC 102104 / LLR-40K-21) TaxID=446470 RepID=D3PW55_STANL|nr:MMPL family transporter [Stackebrandtia nassauensis]ADD41212.1 MMPL domain protein [Stackebrandtia nassauensis DSM 44728]
MSTWKRLVGFAGGKLGRWPVVSVWILLALAATAVTGDLDQLKDNSTEARLPADAPSAQALELAEDKFEDDGHEPLFVVYHRPGGITDADTAAAQADHEALQDELAMPGATTPDPLLSEDGEAIVVVAALPPEAITDDALEATMPQVDEILDADKPSGLEVVPTGPVAAEYDLDAVFEGLDTKLLLVTAGIVALLLLLIYRSPLLLLLPLACVGVANILTNAAVFLLAKHASMTVDNQATGILTVLVFGVGTDYALLLIARYREELRRREDRFAAMRAALPSTFTTLLATAITTALAMLILLFADLGTTAALGPVAAVGIGCALLTMVTLLPALLAIFGRAVFWPAIPRFDPDAADTAEGRHRLWHRITTVVTRRPRAVWTVTVLALLAATLGAATLSSGLTLADSFTDTPGAVRGQKLMAEHYDAGRTAPVEIYTPTASATEVAATLADVPGVKNPLDERESTNGDWTLQRVVLTDDPVGPRAEATIDRIRAALTDVEPRALVGGNTATTVDVNAAMDRDLRVLIPLILAVVLIVLIVLLRALVAPLLLLASVVLSFAAAVGAAGLVLDALGYTKTDGTFVLYGFLFLVALGIDYTIFLMNRAREETALHGHAEGIRRSLTLTGGVITSAGIVLAATFAVLTVLPLVFMVQIGVLVAIGVLLDTVVVRSLLVPTLALDLGRHTWWPGRLARKPSASPAREEVPV